MFNPPVYEDECAFGRVVDRSIPHFSSVPVRFGSGRSITQTSTGWRSTIQRAASLYALTCTNGLEVLFLHEVVDIERVKR